MLTMASLTSILPLLGTTLAALDIDGFLTSQSFLSSLSNLITTIIMTLINAFLGGAIGTS